MHDTNATVISNEAVSVHYRRLKLKTGWKDFVPGQFVMVRVPNEVVLVRRPFGIVDLHKGVLEICFKVLGKGTHELARLGSRDKINVLGPLGNGFEIKRKASHVLVAGGYGIAPLLGLAGSLVKTGESVSIYYGTKTAADLLYQDELKSLPLDVEVATEDGSAGRKGLVSKIVERTLTKSKSTMLYCCGPEGLMWEMARIGNARKIPTQVSMDRYMACGMGVCLGCVCESIDGTNLRACKEGPVFDATSLRWY